MATLWLSGYPLVTDNTAGTSVTVSGSINQSGFISLMVTPTASGVPTINNVLAFELPSGTAQTTVASGEVGASGNISGYIISGLTSELAYTAWAVASGYADADVIAVSGLAFTTPDITAPVWISGYPVLNAVGGTSGVFELATDGDSRGYVLTLASGAAVPTSASIKLSGSVVDMPTSGTVYYVSKAGLTNETDYAAYCVAEDILTLNIQASGQPVYFTTTDTVAPEWAAGYPSGESVTTTTATFTMRANENEVSGYYIFVLSGVALQTPTFIKDNGTTVDMPLASTIYSGIASGLTTDTDYAFQFIAEDIDGNLQGTGVIVYASTTDIVAPSWYSVYPTVSGEYSTSGVFSLSLTESNCSGYVLALPTASGAPSSSGVVASGTVVDMPLQNIVYDVTVTGLATNTNYNAYIVAQDVLGNLQASPTTRAFSTDLTAPTWTTTSLGSITTSTAVLTLELNDAGSGYFVVVPSGEAAPSIAQVKLGQNNAGASVSSGFSGNSVLVANTEAELNVTNLQYATYYTIYVAGTDDGGNDVATIVSANFRAAVPAPGVSSAEQRRRRDRRIRSNIGRGFFAR